MLLLVGYALKTRFDNVGRAYSMLIFNLTYNLYLAYLRVLVLCYLTGGQIARGDSAVVAQAENSRIRFCLLVLVFNTLRVSVLQIAPHC